MMYIMEEVLYSSEESSASPNGVRVYGNWNFNDPVTGADIAYKWDGGYLDSMKMVKYMILLTGFDVSSIPSQIEGTYKR